MLNSVYNFKDSEKSGVRSFAALRMTAALGITLAPRIRSFAALRMTLISEREQENRPPASSAGSLFSG
jgi:hypothetical protein